MNELEIVFDEFIKEAQKGDVIIKNQKFNIHFYTSLQNQSTNDMIPVLYIRDKIKLLKLINKYINTIEADHITHDKIKYDLAALFINATYDDYNNIENYINRRIDFINTPLLKNRIISNVKSFDSDIEIKIDSNSSETPYAFNAILKNNNDFYQLPVISYGISNDICYIYAIQDKMLDKSSKYQKKIKRKLYALNSNVPQTEEYINYMNGKSTYYPENINDISPSTILALTLFLNELKNNDISKIKIISFLPIRYYAKENSFTKLIEYKSKKENWTNKHKNIVIEECMKELLRIQNNLTQKLLRNFKRMEFHFQNIKTISYPYELEECMTITIDEFKITNNNILNEIIERQKGDLNGKSL